MPSEEAPSTERVRRLVDESASGSEPARAELFELVYDDLRRMAGRQVARMAATIEPTALVHDVYVRLVGNDGTPWDRRSHLLAVAARAMRQLLLNDIERLGAEKRGGRGVKVSLNVAEGLSGRRRRNGCDPVEVMEAIGQLERRSPRAARVVELKFFGGLTAAETADALGVSKRSVEADWTFARTWLAKRLMAEDEAR